MFPACSSSLLRLGPRVKWWIAVVMSTTTRSPIFRSIRMPTVSTKSLRQRIIAASASFAGMLCWHGGATIDWEGSKDAYLWPCSDFSMLAHVCRMYRNHVKPDSLPPPVSLVQPATPSKRVNFAFIKFVKVESGTIRSKLHQGFYSRIYRAQNH